ncbi:MAG: family 10 glycosylhydrolase [Bacteroidota bacterium]
MRNPRLFAGRFCPALLACAIAIFHFFGSEANGQSQDTPFFETRAVWLATVLQDGNWPTTGAPASQQANALRTLIQDAHATGINTFVMQVVARGDAMYPSALLPWSALLAGPGVDPGYNPLAVAIAEAHRLGMELHAWINVYRIGDTSTLADFASVTNPQHIGYAEPGWIAEKGSQVWLDPSATGAKDWLVDVVSEIVENYDVDGVHYDFIRYPEGGFMNDDANFQFDDKGFANLADWRRGNVNAFVEAAYEAVMAIKPWVKVGAAPLGNYRETSAWPALWAYSGVYQESRLWLANGWHDYLAPQIYFSIGTDPEGSNTFASPDFEVLVNEWVAESSGRPIFAGYGAYKPSEGRFPAGDLPLQIDAAREAGAAGQMAFRYDHYMQYADLITTRYNEPALPAAMLHRFEASAPTTPPGLALTNTANGYVQLDWMASSGSAADPLRSYVILRRPDAAPREGYAEDILALVDAGVSQYIDASAAPGQSYYYSIASRSALGMLSNYAEPVSNTAITSVTPTRLDQRKTTIVSVFPNPANQSATLTYYLAAPTAVEIRLHDAIGRQTRTVANTRRAPGLYKTQINTSDLARGVYQVVLRTEEGLSAWPLMVNR